MYLYHRVPPNLHGDTLYPLNVWKEKNPEIYQFHVKKYQGRQQALESEVPPLECLWNDVLHLSPIPPSKIKQALEDLGQPITTTWRYFKFDASQLGLDENNCTIFWCKEKEFGDWTKNDDDFSIFDEGKLTQHTELPNETFEYYKQQIEIGRPPLLHFRTPHVLFKGNLKIGGWVEIVEC